MYVEAFTCTFLQAEHLCFVLGKLLIELEMMTVCVTGWVIRNGPQQTN